MNSISTYRILTYVLQIFLTLNFSSCQPEYIEDETEVYVNNFSNFDLTGISGASVWNFDSRYMIGPFNNDGFDLVLQNLPEHRYIKVNFDLYIHDSWDGNGFEPDGEDTWTISLDEKLVFETSFSNSPCEPPYCLQQSYPDAHLSYNFPRTGAVRRNIPGRCHQMNNANGTSLYRVEKRFGHAASILRLTFRDQLTQPNSPNPLCDESWSLTNIRVRTVSIR
jgi:hypothetical protein